MFSGEQDNVTASTEIMELSIYNYCVKYDIGNLPNHLVTYTCTLSYLLQTLHMKIPMMSFLTVPYVCVYVNC